MCEEQSEASNICWACKVDLQPDQLFCSECKHWQNWREYTSFSATILALLVALISVSCVTIPALMEFLSPEIISLDMGGEQLKICPTPADCTDQIRAENGYSALRLKIENRGNVDVLLSKRIECNQAALGHFIEQDDEFLSHTYRARSSTGLDIGEVVVFDYVYQTYEDGFTQSVIYGLNLCVLEISGRDLQYFTFYLDMDLGVFGGRLVQINQNDLHDSELFEAIKQRY